jgi:hypothetical protein
MTRAGEVERAPGVWHNGRLYPVAVAPLSTAGRVPSTTALESPPGSPTRSPHTIQE